MPRYFRKLAIRSKIEGTYGTDSVPTGADNAILAHDVSFTPLAGGEEMRDLLLPWMGHQGVILTGNYGLIEFGVEVAGAGAAGTAPAYGPLLRACGRAQTGNAGVSAGYAPVSAAFEAVTHYFDLDGVRHILLGSRGNVTMDFNASRIPRFRFRLLGLLGTVSDQSLPAVTLTAFQTPVEVSKANTTFSLHSLAAPTESVSIDLGNQVEPRLLINHESIQIVDRRATAQAVMEAVLLATKNWQSIALGHTTGALALAHGTAAGNIVEIAAPAAQVGRWTQGQSQGIVNNSLPLMLKPTGAGNDELTITVK